jgi:hypothetical protein
MRELIAVLDKGLQSSGFQRLLLQLPQAGLRFHSPHGLLLAFVLNCLLKFQLHLNIIPASYIGFSQGYSLCSFDLQFRLRSVVFAKNFGSASALYLQPELLKKNF